jgi:osmotically-inducible protein OsmY
MTLIANGLDSEILRRVNDELEWNPRVESEDLTAKVKDRIVTLSGFIDSYAHKLAAVDAVHQIAGVLDVADEIEVRSRREVKADEEISRAVRAALVWDVYVPDERIQSTVSHGWITLEGKVDRWQQCEDACTRSHASSGQCPERIVVETPTWTKPRSGPRRAAPRRAEREAKHLEIHVRRRRPQGNGGFVGGAQCRRTSHPRGRKVVNEITVDATSERR